MLLLYSDLISFGIYCFASCFQSFDEVPIWEATTVNPQILSQNAFHLNDIATRRIEDWSIASLFRVCLLKRYHAYGSLTYQVASRISIGRRHWLCFNQSKAISCTTSRKEGPSITGTQWVMNEIPKMVIMVIGWWSWCDRVDRDDPGDGQRPAHSMGPHYNTRISTLLISRQIQMLCKPRPS